MLAREVTRAKASEVQRPQPPARPLSTQVNQATMREVFKSPASKYRYVPPSQSSQASPMSRHPPFVPPQMVSTQSLKRRAPDAPGYLASLSQNDSLQENQPPIAIEDDPPQQKSVISKLHEDVYFDENDFDDIVDFDNESPLGRDLKSLPQRQSPLSASLSRPKGAAGGTTITAPLPISSAPTGWSSSPLEHKATPPNADLLRRPASYNYTAPLQDTVHIDLTSDATEDVNPRPKKKRSLPWKSSGDSVTASSEGPGSTVRSQHFQPPQNHRQRSKAERVKVIGAGTPRRASSSEFPTGSSETPKAPATPAWEKTASAIKAEQKKLRRANKNAMKDNAEASGQTRIITSTKKKQVSPVFLSDEQKRIMNLVVDQGKSVFFTGSAGTGKSVLLREIIAALRRKYKKEPDRIAVTASTGLAACNVGGVTLHSFGGIGLGKEDVPELVRKIKRNQKAKNRWARTKVLIVDEISMVDGDLFDKLEEIAKRIRSSGRPFGGIQLIITGDFFQLPPVPDYGKQAKFAFDAATWSTAIEHTIGLTQVFRQKDPVFANVLNEMRLGNLTAESNKIFRSLERPIKYDDNIDGTELFPTRQEVERANMQRMKNLTGESKSFLARDAGTIQDKVQRDKLLANCMAPINIELKKGSQVMLIKNIDETLVNGSLGKVIAFMDEKDFDIYHHNEADYQATQGEEPGLGAAKNKLQGMMNPEFASSSTANRWPLVRFAVADGTSRDLLCQPEIWKIELPNGEVQASRTQIPLILAWALSIHKAQGQTLERVKVDLGKVFEKGQAYVALSRATCQEGLQVLRFNPAKVQAHPRVRTFYQGLYSVEDAAKGAMKQEEKTRPAPIKTAKSYEEEFLDDGFDQDAEEAMGYA